MTVVDPTASGPAAGPTDSALRALRDANRQRRRRARTQRLVAAITGALIGIMAGVWSLATPTEPAAEPARPRAVLDPAIRSYADAITDDPFDHTTGRYLYIASRSAGRDGGDVLTIAYTQSWQAADGSGAWSSRSYPLPVANFRETSLRQASFDHADLYGMRYHADFPDLHQDLVCPPGSLLTERSMSTPLHATTAIDAMRYVVAGQHDTGLRLDCRRALLRAVAALNGPTLAGPATDPLGRHGTAITLTSGNRHLQLIFDEHTGMLLSATEHYLTSRLMSPGVVDSIVFQAVTRTDLAWPASEITEHSRVIPVEPSADTADATGELS